nr:hypothetical protein [Moritella viscosa]
MHNRKNLQKQLGFEIATLNELKEIGITRYFVGRHKKVLLVDIEYNCYENMYYNKSLAVALYERKKRSKK